MKFLVWILTFLSVIAMCMMYVNACDSHDSDCTGANGSQGSCCGGMHCQKNNPSWAKGKCYYNPGK